MLQLLVFTIVLILAFLINGIATPLLIRLSHKHKWYDSIDERKIHPDKMPRIGGVGIFAGFALAAFIYVVGCHVLHIKELNYLSKYSHLLMCIGYLIIVVMGLADDFYNLKAGLKFVIQIIAALCITLGGFRFTIFSIAWTPVAIELNTFWSHALTILWIISFCNAINLMDGMDGLAGGIASIGAVFYIIIFALAGNFTAVAVSACILGSIVAFLVFNYPPAKIYMGDSGSLLLGFSMAVIPLIHNAPPVSTDVLFPALLIFIIPILDMVAAIIRRKRRGRPIFSPDREHLHHKLQDIGFTPNQVLAIIYSFSVVAGSCALMYCLMHGPVAILFFFAVWLFFIMLFVLMHKRYRAFIRRKKG